MKKKATKPRQCKILFLETNLDERLSSDRSQIRLMKELFSHYENAELITKEIHSKSDLIKFIDFARKDKTVKIIHISSHGNSYKNKCNLTLTNHEKIDLTKPEIQKIFKGLDDVIIYFSCCHIGKNDNIRKQLLEISKAAAIFAYTNSIEDEQCFIIEPLFYHLLLRTNKRTSLSAIYEKLRFIIDYFQIDESKDPLGCPLLMAEIKGTGIY
jgi:hypothetical protein